MAIDSDSESTDITVLQNFVFRKIEDLEVIVNHDTGEEKITFKHNGVEFASSVTFIPEGMGYKVTFEGRLGDASIKETITGIPFSNQEARSDYAAQVIKDMFMHLYPE